MKGAFIFVKVEFTQDENVAGIGYWYVCDDESVAVGDAVTAPLGRHNREQVAIVRRVLEATAENAPYPMNYIKKINKIIAKGVE